MIALPTWLHELASLLTVGAAALWLGWRWLKIGQPRAQPGCARCEHNPASERATTPVTAVRSPRLRVLR